MKQKTKKHRWGRYAAIILLALIVIGAIGNESETEKKETALQTVTCSSINAVSEPFMAAQITLSSQAGQTGYTERDVILFEESAAERLSDEQKKRMQISDGLVILKAENNEEEGSLDQRLQELKEKGHACQEGEGNTESLMTQFKEKLPDRKNAPKSEPETQESSQTPAAGIRPEFQEAMDSYLKFYEEYAAFIRTYSEQGAPAEMLPEYLRFLQTSQETMEKLDQIDDGELSDAELNLYLETTLKIQQLLMEAAG